MVFDSNDGPRGILSTSLVDLTPGDDGAVITSIETYALAVPLARPIADSTAAISSWIVPVVEIKTADGRVGTGISGVHAGPELLCDVINRYYAPALIGSSAQDILGTWKRLYWLPTHRHRPVGPGGTTRRGPPLGAARRNRRRHRDLQHGRRLAELRSQ